MFDELLITSKKPVTEIKISDAAEYKFKKDKVILEIFQDWIDTSNPGLTKEELHAQTEGQFQHLIEQVRPLFNKLTFLSKIKRHLLTPELLQRADYPFDRQQLQANEQAEAALISNSDEVAQKSPTAQLSTFRKIPLI